MAEFAASIIGIVSAGTKVTLVLSQLAADVGSAGKEARMIGGEIRAFCAVVKTLGETLERVQGSPYYAHCAELVKDMTEASMEMYSEILDAAESLNKMATAKGKDGKMGIVGKVQFAVFQKPKIAVLRAAIEAYKSNLALLLGTLNVADKVSRRMTMTITSELISQDEQDRSTLESLELDCQASILELRQADEQIDVTLAISGEYPHSEAESNSSLLNETNTTVGQLKRSSTFDENLVESAREEIGSIRSSIVSSTLSSNISSIQENALRHSQRLSLLMIEDQHRISQRWSTVFTSSQVGGLPIRNTSHISPDLFDQPQAMGETSRPVILTSPSKIGENLRRELPEPYWVMLEIVNNQIRAAQEANPGSNGLPSLTVDLGNHDFEYVPLQIIEMMRQQLERLSVSHNHFSKLSQRFALCFRLRYLNLSHNRFTEFPSILFQIPSLEILDLAANKITSIPYAISTLRKLKTLAVQKNRIRRLPFILKEMPNLMLLLYKGNDVTFPLDSAIEEYIQHRVRKPVVPENSSELAALRTTYIKKYLALCTQIVPLDQARMGLDLPPPDPSSPNEDTEPALDDFYSRLVSAHLKATAHMISWNLPDDKDQILVS